jgi:hypothetical protein
VSCGIGLPFRAHRERETMEGESVFDDLETFTMFLG